MSSASSAVVWRRGEEAPDEAQGRYEASPDVICLRAAGYLTGVDGGESSPPEPRDAELATAVETLHRLHGEEAADRVHGAASWIVWDRRRRRLTAIGDRVGYHRVYWLDRGDLMALALRVEPLLEWLEGPPRPDLETALRHIHGQPPAEDASFFEGIRVVPPGGALTIANGRSTMRRYWRPRLQTLRRDDDAGYANAFRELLQSVVESHLPRGRIGILLSGGLDSTSVAAAVAAAGAADRTIAYRWVSPDVPESDEDALSSAVVRRFGFEDRVLDAGRFWTLSEPGGLDTVRAWPIYGFYENLWRTTLERVAADGVGALLTGAGGDHLFGGNVFGYADLLVTGRWIELARQLRERLGGSGESLRRYARRMIAAPMVVAWAPWLLSSRVRVAWLEPGIERPAHPLRPCWALPGRAQRLRGMRNPRLAQSAEVTGADGARFGVDVRHPLYDPRLMEFALSLPTHQSFRAGVRKIVMRNALRDELPAGVVNLPQKIIAEPIARRGLRERETAKAEALMTDMRAERLGLVDADALRRSYRAFVAGEHDDLLFWATLTFEDWLRRHFPDV